jgi:hypothetical protein
MQRAFKRKGKWATERGEERGGGLAFSAVLLAGASGASGRVEHGQTVCHDPKCVTACHDPSTDCVSWDRLCVCHDPNTGGAGSFSCGQTDVDEMLTLFEHFGHFLSRWNIQTCVRVV